MLCKTIARMLPLLTLAASCGQKTADAPPIQVSVKPHTTSELQLAGSSTLDQVNLRNCLNLGTADVCDPAPLKYASAQPSVADVLGHTLVAKPWMATRLRDVLQKMPPEFLKMATCSWGIMVDNNATGSANAIIVQGGTILLNPAILAQTEEELASIRPAGTPPPTPLTTWNSTLPYWTTGTVYFHDDTAHNLANIGKPLVYSSYQPIAALTHEWAHACDRGLALPKPPVGRDVKAFVRSYSGSESEVKEAAAFTVDDIVKDFSESPVPTMFANNNRAEFFAELVSQYLMRWGMAVRYEYTLVQIAKGTALDEGIVAATVNDKICAKTSSALALSAIASLKFDLDKSFPAVACEPIVEKPQITVREYNKRP